MHPMLTIAIRAARSAGDIIIRAADNAGKLQIKQKSRNDYATEVDYKAEQEIIRIILAAYIFLIF